MTDHLIIFDTTLRDGEQSPGASMTREEKMRIAKQLERLRVDVIEAGFPASSNGDFEAVQAIAAAIKDSTVCGLARANENDVARCGEAIRPAKSGRVHTFIAASPIHMQMKLRMAPEQVLEQAVKAVGWARRYTDDVEFSPEDAGRSEPDFLCRMLEAVIRAGRDDGQHSGYRRLHDALAVRRADPHASGARPEFRSRRVVGPLPQRPRPRGRQLARGGDARRAPGRVHDQRAWRARGQRVARGNRHGRAHARRCRSRARRAIDTTQIVPASKLVSGVTGFAVQPNKAIVGANAFAHESGIHQDGVLKHRETYEIMRAEDVGWGANKLVLGKLSGRNAFRTRLVELGIELKNEESLNLAFVKFKELADKKGEVFDEDLHALVSDEALTPEQEHYRLLSLKVVSETGAIPHARLTVSIGGVSRESEIDGDGPVDAVFKAIEDLAPSNAKMLLFSVNAITTGTDAQGEVTVRLERGGRIVNGNGSDTDIIVASAKAYLNALNKLHNTEQRLNPQLAA